MRALFFIAAFLVATILPAVFGTQVHERANAIHRSVMKKLFSAENSVVVETESNLRLEGRSPITQGHAVVYDFGEGKECKEKNLRSITATRLNTCQNLFGNDDPKSKEKAYLLYAQKEGDKIYGYAQSYSDSACTKKRGKPSLITFKQGECHDGSKIEITNEMDFSKNDNHGVAVAFYTKQGGCTNKRYNNIVMAVATPHGFCQEAGFDPDFKTTACDAKISYTDYTSYGGQCTGSASPDTRDKLSCQEIPVEAGKAWVSEYCL